MGHPRGRLESWKEIAAYIGRDVRTAQRWEKTESLPVHRQLHKSLASVYAFPDEIDAWIEQQRLKPASGTPPESPAEQPQDEPKARRMFPRKIWIAGAA